MTTKFANTVLALGDSFTFLCATLTSVVMDFGTAHDTIVLLIKGLF